uniref:alanine and glycine-rich protein-like n=1 Tax=Arvicanthis niloticus TaxID=61156 RepID=UPI001485D999|nr:alanine and glycine-rich protein-like [Arvicanthis niloticus]
MGEGARRPRRGGAPGLFSLCGFRGAEISRRRQGLRAGPARGARLTVAHGARLAGCGGARAGGGARRRAEGRGRRGRKMAAGSAAQRGGPSRRGAPRGSPRTVTARRACPPPVGESFSGSAWPAVLAPCVSGKGSGAARSTEHGDVAAPGSGGRGLRGRSRRATRERGPRGPRGPSLSTHQGSRIAETWVSARQGSFFQK